MHEASFSRNIPPSPFWSPPYEQTTTTLVERPSTLYGSLTVVWVWGLGVEK